LSVGCKSLFGPLDDALCSPVRQRQGMPPRVSLDTSSRASRKLISNGTDGRPAQAADNSFSSALDVPPRRPTTALRRRGSDGDSPRYRNGSSHHHHHHNHHHDKYPSMGSPTEPHPLIRRASTTARTARHASDTGNNTRPRLSRALSPSTPLLAVKSPPPPDFTALPDKAESHRTVLAHEVQ
jgi:hypothetical protein